jgi:DNA-binding IclR family transcriptional regulator
MVLSDRTIKLEYRVNQDRPETGVAAVERALSILDAFREDDDGVTLSELARRTGLYKSTTLRLIASLKRWGYIRHQEDGRYRPGPAGFRLGQIYQRGFRLVDAVMPALRSLARDTGESASFYIREGDERVCLHRVESARPIRHTVHEGARLPLAGASGKVLCAFAGDQDAGLDAVRRDHLALSRGERSPDAAAIAAPVFGVGQRLIGALNLSGPIQRFTPAATESFGQAVREAAAELTRALGGDARACPVAPTRRSA